MTEIIVFGSSRQHHYGAVDQEESRSGALVSTEKVALMSKRKLTDWLPTIINTRSSSGVIRMGVFVGTPGHFQSQLP